MHVGFELFEDTNHPVICVLGEFMTWSWSKIKASFLRLRHSVLPLQIILCIRSRISFQLMEEEGRIGLH